MSYIDENMFSIRDNRWLLSLVCTFFVAYPSAVWLWCELNFQMFHEETPAFYITLFVLRLFYYWFFIWLLLIYNMKHLQTLKFTERLMKNTVVTGVGLLIYILLSKLTDTMDMSYTLIVMQFASGGIICMFLGYIFVLSEFQRTQEQEIEELRLENLESRLAALTAQINPHFFFNSLNGLSSLIRKDENEKALSYVNKLSSIFRYTLNTGGKSIVTVAEELEFVEAFCCVMEVRYGNNLKFEINISPEYEERSLPILSLLPLLENVAAHNRIDSENSMTIILGVTDDTDELYVQNAISKKMMEGRTNGTGLKNLQNRYKLLMNKDIRVVNDGHTFTVYLPL